MKSGIYKIVNLINNKIYIGSSKNLQHRKRQHFSDLRLNKHRNEHLQRSYNKHGLENFSFTVVEYCNIDILLEREKYYIELCNPEYNMRPITDTIPKSYKPLSIETRKQIGEAVRKYWFSRSVEYREERIKKLCLGTKKRPKKIPKTTPRYLCQMCKTSYKSNTKVMMCINCRKKNPVKGKIISQKTREKLRMANIGKECKSKRKVEVDGTIYQSIELAAKAKNITPAAMRKRIKSEKYGYKIEKSFCLSHDQTYPESVIKDLG